MLLFLRDRLPACVCAEIALFDGRVFRAYLREYISEVYSPVYKRYFGHRHSLIPYLRFTGFTAFLRSVVDQDTGEIPRSPQA